MKRTKIICTIGPASESKEVFKKLVESGLDVARLNFSHGTHEEHLQRIRMIREVSEELGKPIAILLDTKGPEIRTCDFTTPVVELIEGQEFFIMKDPVIGDQTKCSTTYRELSNDVKIGDHILIDDGLVGLEVTDIIDGNIKTVVLNSGEVKKNKGINVPGVEITLPALIEKDIQDIHFGIEHHVDFIAASFIRKAADVLEIRKILEENNAEYIRILSKIENQQGVDHIDEILEVSDGIMVGRGDLGVEISTENLPVVQKAIIKICNKACKTVITATQMLDSMIRNPRPTRAEATDVANAILDGSDAIMLSGETAAGKYPVESVVMMANISKKVEESIDYRALLEVKNILMEENSVTRSISYATCSSALDLNAKAIITATTSGFTARRIAQLRPKSEIYALTIDETVCRQLALEWGVTPIMMEKCSGIDSVVEKATLVPKEMGLLDKGDLIILTAGEVSNVSKTTNYLKIQTIL